ncbi:MAG: peptidylprolyl isomerase, partial [Bacteroidota bacterium]
MVQGKNPHPSVKQAFTNPQTGVFDPNQVIQFLKNMDKDETGATKERWINFEQAVKQEKIANKFYTMIKKGIYVTKAEVKRANVAQNKIFKFTYASQKYFSVPDSIFKVDESELKKYYGENKNKYNQDYDSRSIEFVSFDVNPSDEDRNAAMQDILKLGNEFAVATNDSEFVNINSDSKFQEKYFSKAELNKNIDTLYNSSIGKIVGPYLEGNTYKIAKLSKIKMVPDSVKARHILVKAINGDMSKAKAKADSLKKLIKAGANFDELARVNSEDPGSGAKGGDLGFFKEGMMVKPFNDACFNGNVGDMPIVESQFGIHLIEVMAKGKESKKILVSFLDRQIDASSKTFGLIFQQASEFAGKNTTEEL